MAGPPASDGTATLTAPLSLRDRRLFLGPCNWRNSPRIMWR